MANAFRRTLSALLIISTTILTLPCSAQTAGLTCSSDDMDYHYCRADTENRVELVRQLSGSRCEQGYSWGFDFRGIWVDRGCRANFNYGRPRERDNGGNNTGAMIAGGILGALIVGAIASSGNSDSSRDGERVNYYNDGYRMGRQDADNGKPNFYQWWKERYPSKYERDFSAGYADGFNNNSRRPPR